MNRAEKSKLLPFALLRGRRAFAMAEVLITIGIAAVIITASISLMMFNSQYIKQQQMRSGAMSLASTAMETLRKTPFNQLVGSSERIVVDDNRTPDDDTDDIFGSLRIEIKDKAGNLMAGPPVTIDRVEVCITITWLGAGRYSEKEYKESLVTYITP